jgi:hypothetical protein
VVSQRRWKSTRRHQEPQEYGLCKNGSQKENQSDLLNNMGSRTHAEGRVMGDPVGRVLADHLSGGLLPQLRLAVSGEETVCPLDFHAVRAPPFYTELEVKFTSGGAHGASA